MSGTHIIGGDFSYRCLSSGEYAFTLTMYRDCQSDGANFDSAPGGGTGRITIYNGSAQPLDIFQLPAPDVEFIDPEQANPCAEVPPDVCVQRGTYEFELDLPVSGDSYYVVYQRCCRNPTITNIVDPDEQGMTFVLDINPQAQLVCNNSPYFKDLPPPVVCVGEALNFDHSAIDPDGDQIVYSFCNPTTGGSQNNPAPNPDLPPPYTLVDFVVPFYSATNPMGGNPQVSINNATGLISGTPGVEGQFVVGVCVSEYRNGVLLSQLQRDFQFNVTTCNPVVNADIDLEIDPNLGTKTFDICGSTNVDIINESQIEANIDEYYWEIQVPPANFTFNTRDVSFTLPDYGHYEGIMILNPGSQCKDSLEFVIRASPPVEVEVNALYDTCEVGPVQYLDISPLRDSRFPIAVSDWNLDDGFISSEQFPLVQYETPGIKNISLQLIDSIGCEGAATTSVIWQPAPEIVIVEPSEDEICPETTVFFNNESFPIDDTYQLNWDFGTGGLANGINTAHTYNDPGSYTLALEIISPIGCYKADTFVNLIFVDSFPVADFYINYPDEFDIDNAQIELVENARRAVGWDWLVPDGSPFYGPTAMYEFQDTGFHQVGLIVQHEFGCYDTLYQMVDVAPRNSFRLPNAFTPNNDGLNDFFGPVGLRLEQMEEFTMHIHDRWGRLVFTSNDPNNPWFGNVQARNAQEGLYTYVIAYKLPRQPLEKREGVLTLIR